MSKFPRATAVLILAAVFATQPVYGAEDTSVEELRQTLINLLDGLVQKGVLTREQAQAMVSAAQTRAKAEAAQEAAQQAAQAEAEKDAVHVQYVPKIVQDRIAQDVSSELRPQVTQDVIAEARQQGWGVPGALPDWVDRLSIYGDLRMRYWGDMFAQQNQPNSYPNYLAANQAGGLARAGINGFFDTTVNKERERLRLRLGIDGRIDDNWGVTLRFTTGDLPQISTNQTLGTTGQRYQFSVDEANIHFKAGHGSAPWLTAWLGRMQNPYLSSDLLWYQDLTFEGEAATARAGPFFLTLGAFPVQSVQVIELDSRGKWLLGSQLGLHWSWARNGNVSFGIGDFDYAHIAGRRNAPNSQLTDWTAPAYLQKGNSVFDIRNDTDPTTNLYALAANFNELDAIGVVDVPLGPRHTAELIGDYVNNIGYDVQNVLHRVGYGSIADVPEAQQILYRKQGIGYKAELSVGTAMTGKRNDWRVGFDYRYLERDAVLDALADQDFHLGGTGAKGYVVKAEWWFRDQLELSMKYFSTNAIVNRARLSDGSYATDAAPYGIDTLFVDFLARF